MSDNKVSLFPRVRVKRAAVLLVLLLAGYGLNLASPLQKSRAKRKPNIILILADDLGYGDLGSYGQRPVPTHNLDRMAHEGMRFTNFYAGSPVCAPSRDVLMTGLHTGHSLIRGNAKINFRPQDVTVAEVLKQAGYTTGLIGKWGLGGTGTTGAPVPPRLRLLLRLRRPDARA